MTAARAMDAGPLASYLRAVGVRRPSRLVMLATAAIAAVLAAGGFVVGRSGDGGAVPATAPLTSAPHVPAGDAIPVPDKLDLPDR